MNKSSMVVLNNAVTLFLHKVLAVYKHVSINKWNKQCSADVLALSCSETDEK